MKVLALICFYFFSFNAAHSESNNKNLTEELNAYWSEVSRTVREGDFIGYKATCHEEGVLVSGVKSSSYPLSDALSRWKKDFDATKQGKIKANVRFRFSKRINDATTAHETGIFLYSSQSPGGKQQNDFIYFEALLVKKDGEWKIIMEYQKSKATEDEWKKMKSN